MTKDPTSDQPTKPAAMLGEAFDPKAETHAARLRDRIGATPVIFWAFAFAAQLPLLVMYMVWVLRFEHYQYFPFLLLAIGGLTWFRVSHPVRYPTGNVSIGLFFTSLLILVVGCLLNSPWFASVSFFMLVTSFLAEHGLFYLCLPLLLLIRLPLNGDILIITSLQKLTTRLSSFVLDLFYVPHLAHGNVIELADRELFVAEACSGVQSAFTIAFIALLIAAWRRRPFLLIPVYLAISIVWALLCNTLRVTSIAYAAASWQIDLSAGLAHEAIGYGTLLLAGLLTLSTDSLLELLFHSVGEEADRDANGLVAMWERLIREPAADLAIPSHNELGLNSTTRRRSWEFPAVLSVGSVSFLSLFAHAVMTPNMRVVNAAGNVLIEPAPTMLDGLTGLVTYRYGESMRGGKDTRLGMNADQWSMRYGDITGTLVFSQPYPEWHELSLCYSLHGWDLVSTSLLQTKDRSVDSKKIKLARLIRRDGARGYLLYAGLNIDGTALTPPGESFASKFFERCTQVFTRRGEVNLYSGDCAMLQIWVVTEQELSGEALSELADSITLTRELFAKALIDANVSFLEGK